MLCRTAWLVFLTFCLLVTQPIARARPDFTGSYVWQSGSEDLFSPREQHHAETVPGAAVRMEVVQSASSITVTLVWKDGHTNINEFHLDGKNDVYHSPDGEDGKYHAHLKGEQLFIETTVVRDALHNGHPSKTHSRIVWTLSNDGKTLTITRVNDWPDVPMNVGAKYTEVFARK